MATAEGMCTCQKCNKTMPENKFYTYKDGTKVEMCKACLTMHVDNFDENTFLWLLEKLDVPYIPEQWNSLRDRAFAKNPNKMNGMSVFGKYLSVMHMKQYKDYGYADSELARADYLRRKGPVEIAPVDPDFEALMKEKLDSGEISEAQYKTLVSTETQNAEMPLYGAPDPDSATSFFNENYYIKEEDIPDPAAELTDEDKVYLAMKWGRLYKPSEWVELERKYNEMMRSFDIQDADTTGTLILICKTYLKMNQAVDCGDMDGFQKLSRVYDSLRKSAKFTAAQNKEQKNDFVDSVGELVALCEKQGFIPRFPTDIPQDKVDATLKDMNDYVHKLVTQDLGFGRQIEDALKKIQIQKEMDEAESKRQETGEDLELEDLDLEQFYDDVEQQKQQDYNEEEESGDN